jgi:hypothetical protein
MSRWKACGIHLLLSAAVAAVVLTLMLTVWYPWPLFEIAGGGRLIFILTGVDVTLGPLITLIIFKSGKKGLKFDLTVIALAQLAALAYGIHTMFLARPVYIAFAVDQFELVTARDIDPQDLAQAARPEFKRIPLTRPRYIAVVPPTDPAERSRLVEAVMKGKDLYMFPRYYVPYEQEAQSALKRAKPLGVLLKRAPEVVQDYLGSSGHTEGSIKFLPLRSPHADAAVLLDAVSGVPLKILRVDPW